MQMVTYDIFNDILCTILHRYKSKYEKVGVLPIRIAKSNVSSVGPSSERFLTFFLSEHR